LTAVLVCILMVIYLPQEAAVAAEEPVNAAMYDVMILSSECDENSSACHGERVEHLVEYYGADWCEPCELIEHELDLLNSSNTFVIQHHPSPADASFLSDSRIRFVEEHRLLFLPSIVLDGEGLLSGSSQGLELSNALSIRETNYSGLSNVILNGSILSWEADRGDRVTVWRTDAVDHQNRNRTHPTLATAQLSFNATDEVGNISSILENENSTFVVILEQSGEYALVSDSLNPSIGIDVFDEAPSTAVKNAQSTPPSQVATLWTIVLVASLLPAIYMRYSIASKPPSAPLQQEE